MLTWNEAVEPGMAVGDHRRPCPVCNKGPRDTALSVTINPDGSYIAHCFRCSAVHRDGRQRLRDTPPPTKPKAPKRADLVGWGREMWANCRQLDGIAVDYLLARGCCLPPPDGHLRWRPEHRHPSGEYTGPALIALITHVHTRQPLSLHQTWINGDGTKPATLGKKARMLLAGHSIANGVIRLWPDEDVTHGLGIAEGIETALSLAHGFQPVWALIDAGHIGKFSPLPGIESLTIACDNDPVGIRESRQCAAMWAAVGVEVFITRQEQNDLNDVVMEVA